MSEKIIDLYFNRDLVLQLGNISKNIVADYDVNIIAPNIYNEIKILLDIELNIIILTALTIYLLY